ncbi:MAG: Gfo/Idh/MocA family oxidoreductase [Lentisphaeria bacterium]|nr:Gfo/Idh/MocA family oxidoreductase [Lentisphaeria bacterium]
MKKKIKLAIVGTGSRGFGCFGQLLSKRDDVDLVALCDTNPVRVRAAAELLNISPRFYGSIDEMAKKETLDGVIITTPDCEHYACAMKALKTGWNVLIDKPLATNAKDGKALIRQAKKSGKSLMIGFNLRHSEVLKRLKKLIDDGVLGRVFIAENREFYGGGRTYMSRWNRSFAKTGGLWIHKASHDFDIFNWLLGFPKPLRVSSFAAVNVLDKDHLPFKLERNIKPGPDCNHCHYQKKCKDSYVLSGDALKLWGDEAVAADGYVKNVCMYLSDKDNHDNGLAMVEYEGGIKVSLFETFICNTSDRIYTIAGDKAVAEVSLTNRTITVTPRWGGDVVTYHVEIPEGGHGGADPSLVDTFCRIVRGEEQSTSTAEHGLLATALGQAAEMSRRQHRMVEMSEVLS